MTGRDLIIYILTNNLEDQPVFLDKGFLNLLSESEAAVKTQVGTATIRVWFEMGLIDGVKVGDELYIVPSEKLTRKE